MDIYSQGLMFLKQFVLEEPFTGVWGSPAVSVVLCGALKDPGEPKTPQQSLEMASQSLTDPHSLMQVYTAAGSASCVLFSPWDNQSPSPPASQLERDVIYEATQHPKKLSLSFQYRHR